MYDFDDPEGPDWEEEVEEVSCDDARTQPEMPEVRNDASPELLRILVDNGLPLVGPSMKTNPNSSVWRDPDDSDDDQAPHLAGDSSDDELSEETGGEVAVEVDEHRYDTDDELGFDHCYARRNGVCRGEAEEVLGKQWTLWDPVAWAINTSSGQEYVDPSTTEKERRHGSTVATNEEDTPDLTQMDVDGWLVGG